MFRSASNKYEKLGKEGSGSAGEASVKEELKRSTSMLQRNPTKKKSHPIFSFMDFAGKKKATAKPEMVRYVEYLKEGGMWDSDSNKPVIYYK